MKLLAQLDWQLQQRAAQGLQRQRRVVESPCAPQVEVNGRPMLAFCSNDYLGLAADARVIDALREGAARYGVGSGASHLISGHSRAHALLEERLAAFESAHLPNARALFFCSGYMANLAVLSSFADRDSALFSEQLNHASLIDGARLSHAQLQIYRHRDLDHLEELLQASRAESKLVLTDSVFSMDGDLAPLPALLALCERHQAWLLVDDAHGFGVLGAQGRGALEHFDLHSPYLIYLGTLGKAAGVSGAFVAAHATAIEWLIQRARPYIYSTAPPPALAHALLTSIDIIDSAEGAERRAQLAALRARLDAQLALTHWQRLPSSTPIQPLIIGANEAALTVAAQLQQQGIWVPAIRPPTVPVGTARLRITLSAAHTLAQVDRLAEALNQLDG